jgi:uncharacterized repeat protein (TIGR01451 family)
VDLTNVTVGDDLAGPATLVDGDTDGDGELDVGETWTYTATYDATQADIDAGTDLVNTATVDSGQTDPAQAQATTTITQNPALTVDKSSTTENIGSPQTVTYNYLVSNTGNVTLTGLSLSDDNDNDDMTCETTSLAVGGSMNCSATYTATQADIDAGGSVENTVTASSNEGASGTDFLSIPIDRNPSLTVQNVVVPTNIDAPGGLTYTITVTNTGNVELNNVVLTDSLSDNATFVSGDTDGDGALDVGESWVYSAIYDATQADIDAGTDLVNTASVTSDEVPGPTEASATTTITQNPSLAIDKWSTSEGGYDATGDVITYSYAVTNDGNVTISGPITVADDKTTVTCPAGDLAPTASLTCSASYSITLEDLDAGSVTNIATASGTDPNGAAVTSPPDSVTVGAEQQPQLTIVKEALDAGADGAIGGDDDTWVAATTIMPSDVAAFRMTVTNTGNVTLYGVELVDDLPNPNTDVPYLTWNVASQTGVSGCAIDPATYRLTCGGDIQLAPGKGFSVIVSTTIPADYFNSVLPEGNGALGSNFEIDGNTQVEDSALTDWNLGGALPQYSVKSDMASGQTDDSFGKGSKNDTATPTVVDGSIPNNKSDLLEMATASEAVASDKFIYLAWLRAETLGTVNIDFELNQNGIPDNLSANLVTAERSVGDVIVSFDFASGENIVQLSLRSWDGTQWSEPIDLDATALASGAVNDPSAFPGVYPSLDLDGNNEIAELTFGEAVINATATFGETLGECRTFNSVYVKSRSSTSFTAALKDFIAPQQVEIDTCRTIDLDNTASVSSSAVSATTDGASIKVTNDIAVAEGAAAGGLQ